VDRIIRALLFLSGSPVSCIPKMIELWAALLHPYSLHHFHYQLFLKSQIPSSNALNPQPSTLQIAASKPPMMLNLNPKTRFVIGKKLLFYE
jgi:hypothetical protein